MEGSKINALEWQARWGVRGQYQETSIADLTMQIFPVLPKSIPES
jgi:hypothetical protein